ncbi:MAG: hypothetical protein QXK51_05755 [Candidatus Methanomethylicia archaeon]
MLRLDVVLNFLSRRVGLVLLLLIPFLIRVGIYFSDFSFRLGWFGYDTDFYIDYGVKCVEELSRGNFTILNIFTGHPPLGFMLIGLAVKLGGIFSSYYSATLLMCLISSMICVVVYYLGLNISRKTGFIAWLLASIDPFYLRYTNTWLDIPMLLFLTLFYYYNLKEKNTYSFLAGVFGGLAVTCKYIAAPIIMLLTLLTKNSWRNKIIVLTVMVIIVMTICPQLRSIENTTQILTGHYKSNVRGEEEWIIGENVVFAWYPGRFWFRLDTFLWTYLYYFGLSLTQPFITPFIAYISIIYKLMKRENIGFNHYWLWLSISLIIFAFIAKHWPYYDVIHVPPLTLITATLLTKTNMEIKKLKIFILPALTYISLTPISLTSSLTFPTLWLFILTIINNKQILPLEYITSLILTIVLLLYSTITSVAIIKNR